MSSSDEAGSSRPRVIILGGGFAGLNVAKGLRRAPVSIVLVDRQNYHTFQPLLYQVATAELEPDNIAAPIRKILRSQRNVKVALGNVTDIDLDAKVVSFAGGELPYDVLVVATGVRQSYFGNDGFKPFAPGLKTVDDALEIRSRVLRAFEEAEWEADDAARRAKLTFVVVGGGPTGVELAGALVDVATNTLPKEFRNVDTRHARVILVEGGPRLVAAMPEELGKRAQRKLDSLGVEIRLSTRVVDVDSEGVTIGEEKIAAENVLWAAGIQGQSVTKTLGVELDRAGRIVVGPDLAVPGHPDVFVVGDAAHATDAKTEKPVPGVAQAAIQTGRFVARVIAHESAGGNPQDRPAFSYHDKGSMAMVGRGNAIAAIGKVHYGGLLGFLTWSLVHVMFLVGFGNKLVVMMGWLWNYLLHSRRARLIIGDPDIHIKRMRESGPRQSERPTGPKLTHDAVGERALEVESDFVSDDKHQ
jgi:NADH dehydrogenase